MRKSSLILILIITIFISAKTNASRSSMSECSEASEFIKNAALSRQNGMDKLTFITKMLADFDVIRSFPESLRWFVRDRQDEDFLIHHARLVFERPEKPEAHQANFLNDCLSRN